VTVRDNTERPVTVDQGTNVIAGTGTEQIRWTIRQQLTRARGIAMPEKWDGHASERIVGRLIVEFGKRESGGAARSEAVLSGIA
jgi:UDP-N-acetylglucosamine 2-epimerase (non-hydrolysing)